jgi:hypothetical protein
MKSKELKINPFENYINVKDYHIFNDGYSIVCKECFENMLKSELRLKKISEISIDDFFLR